VRNIRKVAVLGAGTMGGRIAAHLANASIPSVLLDIVPQGLTPGEQAKGLTLDDAKVRNRFAQAGLEAALNSRPAAFFVPEAARMITLGNFEDNLIWLKDCDWIIGHYSKRSWQSALRGRWSVPTPRASALAASSKASARNCASIFLARTFSILPAT
jgi:hypothetical protein